MDNLIISQNHIVLSKIFLSLDNHSLWVCKQVCKSWYDFITQHIWGSQLYADVLRRRLQRQWNCFQPKVTRFRAAAPVFDITGDENDWILSLENGTVEIWPKFDLKGGPARVLKVPETELNHGFRIGLSPDVVVGGFFEKSLHFWCRRTGDYRGRRIVDSNIHNVKMVADLILVCKVDGNCDLFRWNEDVDRMDLIDIIKGSARCHYHPACSEDGRFLVLAASRRPLILYDLNKRSKAAVIPNNLRVTGIKFSYPLVLLESGSLNFDELVIYNVIRENVARRIKITPSKLFGGHSTGGVTDMNLLGSDIDSNRALIHTEAAVFTVDLRADDGRIRKVFDLETSSSNNTALSSPSLEADKVLLQEDDRGSMLLLDYWFTDKENNNDDDEVVVSQRRSTTFLMNIVNKAKDKCHLVVPAVAGVILYFLIRAHLRDHV